MACQNRPLLADFSENQIKEEFDEDVRRTVMEMTCPHEMLVKAQELKDEGNTLFKSRAYRCAVNKYDKALQYLCLAFPEHDEDVT